MNPQEYTLLRYILPGFHLANTTIVIWRWWPFRRQAPQSLIDDHENENEYEYAPLLDSKNPPECEKNEAERVRRASASDPLVHRTIVVRVVASATPPRARPVGPFRHPTIFPPRAQRVVRNTPKGGRLYDDEPVGAAAFCLP